MLQIQNSTGLRSGKRARVAMVSTVDRDTCAVLLRNIDEALNTAAGAMISERRFDEVTDLRTAIRGLCEEGRLAEARQLESRAMAIIRQATPS